MKFPNYHYQDYQNSIICYIDILGFAQLVQNKESYRIHYALDQIFKSLLRPSQSESFEYAVKMNDISKAEEIRIMIENGVIDISQEIQGNISYFSDTVMISIPVVKNEEQNIKKLQSLFSKLNDLLCSFFNKFKADLSIRGAITIGDICHNENFYYGSGLVEVYSLESKQAKIPRIILSEEMSKTDWVQKAIQNPGFLDHFGSIDISKLDDNYISLSLLKIKQSSIELAFKDKQLTLSHFLEEEVSNLASHIWLELVKKLRFIERSYKRVHDIQSDLVRKKEFNKLNRICKIYNDSLERVIKGSGEKNEDIITSFRHKYKIIPNKYKDHAIDRKGIQLLLDDPVHVYSRDLNEIPQFNGNCCSGRISEIVSEEEVYIFQTGCVLLNETTDQCRCNHNSKSVFKIKTKYLEKEWKYSLF